jgi:hypothetical protein
MQHARLKGVDLHQDSLTVARPHSACQARLRSRYTTRRSPDWLKSKNPAGEAVKREAEDDCGLGGALRPVASIQNGSGPP